MDLLIAQKVHCAQFSYVAPIHIILRKYQILLAISQMLRCLMMRPISKDVIICLEDLLGCINGRGNDCSSYKAYTDRATTRIAHIKVI
ncbi:hypothetical protein H5410_022981 [Solanum commersonii]|uniref:Uncharacterized protein n=1 Tax=Solanum commersonii TaxID=4109 RepID=A0A9J5ZIZ1_SOLCO|nr:hypothetical protein H5410_022981 [Solanum commersonii]